MCFADQRVVDGLTRLLDELTRVDGTAITRYRTFALTLPSARMADLDRVLRVSDRWDVLGDVAG